MQLHRAVDDEAAVGSGSLEHSEAPSVATNRRSENIPYLVGIDHLRAAAAILIVYYHGVTFFSGETRYHAPFDISHWITAPDPLSALIVEGHTSVSLFMVLSGFIFAFGATGRSVAYRDFLANRFLRTYPLFLFVLMVGTAVHFRSVTLAGMLQTLFGGANLVGAQGLGSFSVVLWSVGIEWQFYLLFPALMTILNRAGPWQLGLLVALLLGTRVLGYLQGMQPVFGVYSQLLGRLDQFVLGMIAGWVYARRRSFIPWRYVLPVATALVLEGAFVFNRAGGYPEEHWFKLFVPTLEGMLWSGVVLGYVAMMDQRGHRPGYLSKGLAAVGACRNLSTRMRQRSLESYEANATAAAAGVSRRGVLAVA